MQRKESERACLDCVGKPGKTKSESRNVPLSSLNVQQTSTGRPVFGDSSSNYSEWNVDDKWSSQVWKSGEMSNTSTGRPVNDKFVFDDDMDSDTATESNFSLKSRSFLNRVNDRLRRMLSCSPEDSMQDIDKRSMIWGMFMSSTLEASVFMGKNYSEHLRSIKNTGNNLTMEQMFEMSEKLIVGQSDEISGVTPMNWVDSPWTQFSPVNDEEVISLSHAKGLRLHRICVMPINYFLGRQVDVVQEFTTIQNFGRNRRRTDGIRVEYFQGFTTLELVREVQKFMSKVGGPEQFQGRIIFMSMSMTSYGELKTMKRNVLLIPHLCLYSQKDFQQDVGHSSGLGQKQSGIPLTKKDQEENGIESLN